MWPMLIMGALSAKSNADKAQQQTELDSNTQRYSPWTRMSLAGTGEVHDPNTMGTLAQAYGAYQGQEQNNQRTASQQKLMDAQIRALDRGDYPGRAQSSMIGSQNANSAGDRWMNSYNSRLGSNYGNYGGYQ